MSLLSKNNKTLSLSFRVLNITVTHLNSRAFHYIYTSNTKSCINFPNTFCCKMYNYSSVCIYCLVHFVTFKSIKNLCIKCKDAGFV